MKNIINHLKPFVFSWIAYLILAIIVIKGGYYGFHLNIVLGIFAYLAITYWARKSTSNSKEKIVKTILIGSPLLLFSAVCLWHPSTFKTSPNFLLAQGLGMLLAFVFEKTSVRAYHLAILLLPIAVGGWLYFQGAKIWEHYVIYNTFKSGETFRKAPTFSFTKDSITLTNNDFRGQIVVFDFWNTSCPYCYEKFPALKEKQEKWSKNGNIHFYAVNFPISRDTIGEAGAILKMRDIPIPNLMGPEALSSYQVFGEFAFPLAVILNPEGDIVFWGDIEKIDNTLEKLLKTP
jgi:thiol-disulfide isomerase/thioredoxin